MFSRLIFSGLPVLFFMGCSSSSTSLINHKAWTNISLQSGDIYASEEGATDECPEGSASVVLEGEELAYEIKSRDCPYLTVTQSLTRPIHKGDRLNVRIFHYKLTAPDPGEAHLAMGIDSKTVWETRVPIPSDSGLILGEITAARDYDIGTSILFHFDNHGANTYALIEFSIIP